MFRLHSRELRSSLDIYQEFLNEIISNGKHILLWCFWYLSSILNLLIGNLEDPYTVKRAKDECFNKQE